MVSQHIIEIIVRAQDQASAAASKVESAFNKMGTSSKKSVGAAAQSTTALDNALKKTSPSVVSLTDKIKNMGTNGASAFNTLTASERQLLTNIASAESKMGEFGATISNTTSKTSLLGSSGMSAFNQLNTAEQQALITLSSMSSKTTTTSSQMSGAWETVKSKISSVASTVQTKLSSALDSVKSKVSSLGSSFSGLGGVISSALGGIGMAGISELTIGLAMTREQMTSLTTATMGSKTAADEFVSSMDTLTNNSLVSLNDLGQAMNTIKMSTGMTNEQLQSFSTTVNDIGQRAILMGKDSNEAMTIMQAAGRGLNGEFEILKTNFGITKDKLMDLGWSGAASDVEGYMAAIETYLESSGSMNDMMDTTTGKIQQVKKGFTTAGRQIGEQFMPYINMALDGMIGLKESCPEAYNGIIMVGGGVSVLATALPAIEPAIDTFNSISMAVGHAKNAISTLGNVMKGLSLASMKESISNAAAAISNYGRQAGLATIKVAGLVLGVEAETLATTIQAVKNGELTISQALLNTVMSANPFAVVAIAVMALVAALAYLYNNNETVRNALNQLFDLLKQLGGYLYETLITAWNSLMETLTGVYEFLSATFTPVFQTLYIVLSSIWAAVGQVISIFTDFLNGQTTLPEMLSQIWTVINSLFTTVFQLIVVNAVKFAADLLTNGVKAGWNFLTGVSNYISQLPGKVYNWIIQTASRILTGAARWIINARNKAQATVTAVMNYIKQLPGKVYNEFINIGSRILNAGKDLVSKAAQVGKNIVNGLLDAMGIHSPGIIQTKVVSEFEDMIDSIGKNTNNAYKSAESVGKSIVEGFQSQGVEDTLNAASNISLPKTNVEPIPTSVSATVSTENKDAVTKSLQDMNNETIQAYTSMKNTENLNMGQMLSHVNSTMNSITSKTRQGLTATTTTTESNLKSMLNSTSSVTGQMVNAWNTMKNKIVTAANNIRTGSTTHFNKLSTTIGGFYRKLQNPSLWGAGPSSGSHGSRGAGRTAGTISSLTSKMSERLNPSKRTMTVQEIRTNPCISNSCIEYMKPHRGYNISTSDLLRGNCIECELGIGKKAGAGWSDTAKPNTEYIKKKTRNWSMVGPTILGKYRTGLSFKVSDFENGTPNISFSSFKGMAEAMFSQIPYEFYYDSEKYGSWQNAIANGGCNCSDGSDALIALAHTCGLSAYKQHGYWNSTGHYWAVVDGKKMDTTGWQNQRTWTPRQSHAGPSPQSESKGILETLSDALKGDNRGRQFNESTEVELADLNVNGEVTVKHEFINLPDGLDEQEVARLINETTQDDKWLNTLLQNDKFQDLYRNDKTDKDSVTNSIKDVLNDNKVVDKIANALIKRDNRVMRMRGA